MVLCSTGPYLFSLQKNNEVLMDETISYAMYDCEK